MMKKFLKTLTITLFVIFVIGAILMTVFTIVEIVEYGHILGFNGYITLDMFFVMFILGIIDAVLAHVCECIEEED